ncbi:MAG: hypothetical protein AAB225_21445 [Acidobacteriota bacterium]
MRDQVQYPEITHYHKQFGGIRLYREWNMGRWGAPRRQQPVDLPSDFLDETAANLPFEGIPALRAGFHAFLSEVIEAARRSRVRFQLVAAGAQAVRDFMKALRQHPTAFNVLLVDSEGPDVGRLAGLPEPDIHAAWERGEREKVIAATLRPNPR